MPNTFVPASFDVPQGMKGPGFRLEPLGPEHNKRDHEAWMSSIYHIKATPGFENWNWPEPMSLAENLGDLEGHARDFIERRGFTYSVLDGDEVIGCVYIYPSRTPDHDASVRSWVRASHADLDRVLWEAVSGWLAEDWPFSNVHYAAR
jgi:hypothetical protein